MTGVQTCALPILLDRGLVAALVGTENPAFATTSCTFDGDSLVNIAGDFSGFGVASRLPSGTQLGEIQGTHVPMIDPKTGWPLLLSVYPQFMQTMVQISCLYGLDVLEARKLIRLLSYNA